MYKNRKIVSLLLTVVMLASGLTACNKATETNKNTNSAKTTEVTSSYKTEETATGEIGEIKNLYNPNFKIEVLADGIKKVTDADNRELILVSKELAEVPSEYKDSIVIRTPVENAVFLSSTQVCTFRAVDSEAIVSGIGGVCGGVDSWSTVPAVSEKIASGDIVDVTGEGGMGEPDYEKIQELNPDVVFVYSGEYGQLNQMAKFDELGINYAVDNEYLEEDYLARMEWMRFILTFFNADSEITTVMTKAQENVDAAKAAVAGQDKVKIAIFNVYSGTVYSTADSSWLGSMIADMNGENVFSGIEDKNITLEVAYEKIQDADIIIYSSTPSYCAGIDAIAEAFPQLTECKAYENNRIYQYSDLFWNGIDQSDIMAGDLAAAMYPDSFADRTLNYFNKLEK